MAGFFALLFAGAVGCSAAVDEGPIQQTSAVLRVGFGLATGQNPQSGLSQALSNISLEGLFSYSKDGRSTPWLAEGWRTSADGRSAWLHLRRGVTFHDGTAATASVIRDVLLQQLPQHLGPSFENVIGIRATSDYELEFSLRERSAFLHESLGFPIQAPNASRAGTGAFLAAERKGDALEMLASDTYYGGKPFIERISIKSYSSVRAAWADLLRNEVDMLYEVGVDAIDSLAPSSATKVFRFQRPYTFMVILNVRKPALRDRGFRRALNSAIDRRALVDDVLGGLGSPADGPVSPNHWAYEESLPTFKFASEAAELSRRGGPFTILFTESSHERMALLLQRQLQSIGVNVLLERAPSDGVLSRVQAGDFDAFLADAVNGPTMVRPSLFWDSHGPLNWGGFDSPAVDAALDAIDGAADDAAYKAGVGAFQRAIVDDPPAIFLAWSERARAVSTRFEVPVEPGRDILSTLRLWRPVGAPAMARN